MDDHGGGRQGVDLGAARGRGGVDDLEGGELRVFSIEKTIADCFKFRNRVGLDVALEALRDAWSSNRLDLAKLDAMAKICRVQKVLKPYVEALIV